MATIGTDINYAADLLRQGQVVAIPTETVYGLAGNALSEAALVRIYEAKDRPRFNPLIMHCKDIESARQWCADWPPQADVLAKEYWPGPLTMLFPKRASVPDLLSSGSPRVAIRIPAHPSTKALLDLLDFPLAAPSANRFGKISPTTAAHVNAQIGDKILYILDGGASSVGLESTIIGWEADETVIYRQGGIAQEAIESLIGPCRYGSVDLMQLEAPGMLKGHYAPDTPLVFGSANVWIPRLKGKRIGVISLNKTYNSELDIRLSEAGDLSQAASNLFHALHKLNAADLDVIIAEAVPDEHIGRAINDRLKRAAFEHLSYFNALED